MGLKHRQAKFQRFSARRTFSNLGLDADQEKCAF